MKLFKKIRLQNFPVRFFQIYQRVRNVYPVINRSDNLQLIF